MLEILQTSRSTVLINGSPGPWINCKRGLRQGDALSPYLFILVADLLQCLIKDCGSVWHPLIDAPCPVLQYADDTLILIRGTSEDVINLRGILDSFSDATGLKINYHKSTAVPMHVPESKLRRLMKVLQCKQDTFPQVYLGLPLSNVKLNLQAFARLIAKVDRQLSGWKALLLNHAGCLVLINSVLDGMPAHLMSALLLPAGTIEALDKRRRAFLWSGQATATGAQCLVAWDKVCLPKQDGGLGVKQISVQNACLLLKLLHRLHHPGDSSWAAWVRQRVDLHTQQGEVEGAHWDGLCTLLPAYHQLTSVSVKCGTTTAFWEDRWLGAEPLCSRFPVLYSHVAKHNASVRNTVNHGILQYLVPRLNCQARSELAAVQLAMND